ncbi:hypothetical protein [Bacteroides faecalis]|uniref:hypothetical protein n=1 Tax=Bacteroides faecalis TaxID=2447885 RepID=UPI001F3A431E|nr:hypothetical protein [Bacteroides faecalis]
MESRKVPNGSGFETQGCKKLHPSGYRGKALPRTNLQVMQGNTFLRFKGRLEKVSKRLQMGFLLWAI